MQYGITIKITAITTRPVINIDTAIISFPLILVGNITLLIHIEICIQVGIQHEGNYNMPHGCASFDSNR